MKKKLIINGMTCNTCEMKVKNALLMIDGIKSANVSYEDQQAVIDMDRNINNDELIKAVDEAGFQITDVENA